MKKIIFISIAIIILIIGGVIGYNELTKRSVAIELPSSGYSVAIYNGDNKVATMTQSSTLRLHDGSYSYSVIGDHYADTKQSFKITQDSMNIRVIAVYSTAYLAELLQKEQDAITTVIHRSYTLQQGYNIALRLEAFGDWAIAALKPTPARGQLSDTYYAILQKENGTWAVVATPQLTIDKAAYPTIPASVLYDMYSVTVQDN